MSSGGDPFDSIEWDSQTPTSSSLDGPPEGDVALTSDGSLPSIRSPSLVLQALVPLILSIWLLLAGRRLYRFTTSVSVALSTVFFGWALLVNLESGDSLGGLTGEAAAVTVWSTMLGLGLIGAVLGFQATWWGAHVTGRLCLGANAGLAFAFSILFLRANFSIHAAAGKWIFVWVFAILGIVMAFYDHVTGPLVAIALEGSFLFMLAIDLFVTLGNNGTAAGFRGLIDHNPAHAMLIAAYNPPKSTKGIIVFSWIIGLASFCFQYKYYSMQFGPLPRLRASDEERGLKRATLELAAKRMNEESTELSKSVAESVGDEPETLVITNNHHQHSDSTSLATETLANSADVDQNGPRSQVAIADQPMSIPMRPSRVLLAPPSPYGSPAALALSPTVYSRYRRTPGPSPQLPSHARIPHHSRSNLVRYKQLRRVETVDEVTEASTSVTGGNETDQDQVSLITIGDGAERISTRTDVMSEEYLHAVLRLAAGEGGEGHTNENEQARAVDLGMDLEEIKAPPETLKLRRTDSMITGSIQGSLTKEQLATSPILAKPISPEMSMEESQPENSRDVPMPMCSMTADPESVVSVARTEAENRSEFDPKKQLKPRPRRASCSSLTRGLSSHGPYHGNPNQDAKDEERSRAAPESSQKIGAANMAISKSAPGSVLTRTSWDKPISSEMSMDEIPPENFCDVPAPMCSMTADPESVVGVTRTEAENRSEFDPKNQLKPLPRRASCSSLTRGLSSHGPYHGKPNQDAKHEERSLAAPESSQKIGAANMAISQSAPGSVFTRTSWDQPLRDSRCLSGMRWSDMYSARSRVTSSLSTGSEDIARSAPTGVHEACEVQAVESVRPFSSHPLPRVPVGPDARPEDSHSHEDHHPLSLSPTPQKSATRSLKSSVSTGSSVLDLMRTQPDSSVPTTPSMNGSSTMEVKEEVQVHSNELSKESLVDFLAKEVSSQGDSTKPYSLGGEKEKESVSPWSSGKMTVVPRTPTMRNMLLRVSAGAERVRREASGSQWRSGASQEGGAAGLTTHNLVDEADQDTVRRTQSSRSTICTSSAYRCSSAEDADGPSSGSDAADESDHGRYFQPRRLEKLDQILDEWGKLLGDDCMGERQAEAPRDGPTHRSPSLQSIALPSCPGMLADPFEPSPEANTHRRPGAASFVGESLQEDSWPKKRALVAERGPYPLPSAQRWSSVSSAFPTFGRESSRDWLELRRGPWSGDRPSRVDRASFQSEPLTSSGLGRESEKETSSLESNNPRFCSGSFYLGYKDQSSEKGSEEKADQEALCLDQMDHSAETKSQRTTITTSEGADVTADNNNRALHALCGKEAILSSLS